MYVTQVNSVQSIYISEQDIFLNEDGVPCEGTDPKRHRLLVRRGAQIPYEDVLAFGLDIVCPDDEKPLGILLPVLDEDYLGAVPPTPEPLVETEPVDEAPAPLEEAIVEEDFPMAPMVKPINKKGK